MDIFSFQKHVVGTYAEFSKSFCKIKAPDLNAYIDKANADGKYWPEPLIQVNPNFKVSDSVEAFVAKKLIHAKCADIFRAQNGKPLSFFEHQATALEFARMPSGGESYVVTTGTGSGKSLTYFIPIIDAILTEKDKPNHKNRTMALVVYPMNALANSQIEELAKFLGDPKSGPTKHGITFGRYTGQESEEERKRLADNPPDILLTNYMMLELLLTRHGEQDAKVITNSEGLQFFVLDEMHVYRGRQGADMAMLCRRTLQRLDPEEKAICVGTSATMSSDGGTEEKNKVVASVATKLFGRTIDHNHVITETLDPVTYSSSRSGPLDKEKLTKEIQTLHFYGLDYAALKATETARWVETTLGITKEIGTDGTEMSGWIRKTPISIAEAVSRLGKDTQLTDSALLSEKLKDFLLAASQKTLNDRPLFAFKLHQFVSAPGKLLAPLLPAGEDRKKLLRLDGQIFAKSEHGTLPLFPTHFCRECGQDFHPVSGENGVIRSRDIDERLDKDSDPDDWFGFISMEDPLSPWSEADILDKAPDDWNDPAKDEIRKERKGDLPKIIQINPLGQIDGSNSNRCVFVPGKFRYCPSCGTAFSDYIKDRLNLTPLSGEGRSSATTAISLAALSWLHENIPDAENKDKERRKLLGFSDNRQDSALQAGHFNDFKRILLVRGALIRALETPGRDASLLAADAGDAIFQALEFSRQENLPEYLKDSSKQDNALLEDQQVAKDILSFRAIADLQDSGRYNNPSLERLGLVKIQYDGLKAFCANDAKWSGITLRFGDSGTPEQRFELCEAVLDKMRAKRCIQDHHLTPAALSKLRDASFVLAEDWGFTEQEKDNPVSLAHFGMLLPEIKDEAEKKDSKGKGAGKFQKDNGIVKCGPTSFVGRAAKSKGIPNGKDYAASMQWLAGILAKEGFLAREQHKSNGIPVDIFRVDSRKIRWTLQQPKETNYFSKIYQAAARSLATNGNWMFSLEAREHTAQVDQDERQTREERFRFTKEDRAKLVYKRIDKRLPLLFCSPTMELGVDISSLDVVYMRNTPPTPANYAQRAGRAGRAGQAALAITYCASQSPHDQYFFSRPDQMVAGSVKAPNIDLSNPDLIRSHLHALWLTHMGAHLESSIGELVEKPTGKNPDHTYPVLKEIAIAMRPTDDEGKPKARFLAAKGKAKDLILGLGASIPDFPSHLDDAWAAHVIDKAHESFDASLNRWRELCRAADRQIIECQKIIDNRTADQEQIKEAKGRRKVAETQIDTLLKGKSSFSDDFYSYRELASQGFLPGYNFPRLPLMAYLPPREEGDNKRTFLSRPRFLALGEFGPFSLIYHEGRRYRVDRAILSLSGDDKVSASSKLPLRDALLCPVCGYGHFGEQMSNDLCLNCNASLDNAKKAQRLFRIDNVSTRPVERINANEEERSKQGYDIKTTFQFAGKPGGAQDKVSIRYPLASGGEMLLSYGPSATIWRINYGFKRERKSQAGFFINPISGRWLSNPNPKSKNSASDDASDAERVAADAEARSEKTTPENIIPYVEDRRNALLVYPPATEDIHSVEIGSQEATLAQDTYFPTLHHALKRGIEAAFDLEESELMAEPLPDRDTRKSILFYESAEGGAGVLTRLATDSEALSRVAKAALEVMHYSSSNNPDDPIPYPNEECEKACYRCLLSYSNQMDHRMIDRTNPFVLATLRALCETVGVPDASKSEIPALIGGVAETKEDSLLAEWISESKKLSLPAKPFQIGDLSCSATPDAQIHSKSGKPIAIYIGRSCPEEDRNAMEDIDGFVFEFRSSRDKWPETFERLEKRVSK